MGISGNLRLLIEWIEILERMVRAVFIEPRWTLNNELFFVLARIVVEACPAAVAITDSAEAAVLRRPTLFAAKHVAARRAIGP